MATQERVVEQSRSDDFDVSEIPPEAPEGGWLATPTAVYKSSKNGDPMISIRWKLDQADEEENAEAEGRSVFDHLVLPAKTASWYRMAAGRLQSLCHAIDLPTKANMRAMVDAINKAGQVHIFTVHETNKDTGEIQTRVAYKEPAGRSGPVAESQRRHRDVEADDGDDDGDRKPAKKNGTVLKKSKR